MASKSKPTNHSQSKSPSTSHRTSRLHSEIPVSRREEEGSTTTAQTHHTLECLSPESPEVHSIIEKLQGFSISPPRSEVSQGNQTSQFHLPHHLTRLQSEKLGIEPPELPLPQRKMIKKNTEGSGSETFSPSSSSSSSPVRIQTPTSPLHIIVHQGTSPSTSQSFQTSFPPPPQAPGTPQEIVGTPKMA